MRYSRTEQELDKAIDSRRNYNVFHTALFEPKRDTLLKLIHYRNSLSQTSCTVRIDYDCFSVYSNDLVIINSLEKIVPDHVVHYTEVNVEGDVGVLLRNNPKHEYRTYFRTKTIPEGFHLELENFLEQYKKTAYPTPSLKKWLKNNGPAKWRLRYLDACFFIEYDHESFLSILSLNFGDYLGKTYKVQQR